MSKEKIIFGAIAGIAVGALLGVLFAPDKGSVTRKKIFRKSDDYIDELKNRFEELLGKMAEKNEEDTAPEHTEMHGKEHVTSFSNNGHEKSKK